MQRGRKNGRRTCLQSWEDRFRRLGAAAVACGWGYLDWPVTAVGCCRWAVVAGSAMQRQTYPPGENKQSMKNDKEQSNVRNKEEKNEIYYSNRKVVTIPSLNRTLSCSLAKASGASMTKKALEAGFLSSSSSTSLVA